ncbi:MAG TPA: hypothetical protein VMB81_26375 [Candidatus Sulfotelmatobacter sp.]|nr:hypothetical protein [Candidatus Sulfotelmatobacter sp.]
MASLSDTSLTSTGALRSLVIGGTALVLVAIGLRVLTTQETSFYRSHMVPDERTAIRLAELVLGDPARGCVFASAPTARLDGDVWIVEGQPASHHGMCRVELARKDGQILDAGKRS